MELPAIIKVLLVFVAVLAATRLRLPLGFALIGGGIGLELWAGRSVSVTGADLGNALLLPELWLLMLNITLIMEIGHFMAAERNSEAIIAAARRWGGRHGQAVSLVLIPAAIGMVPMPGGALFSAPLIARSLDRSEQTDAWKTVVNYWFRHILEYWWPLYPVVIVTLSIFTIETWKFMLLQIPFTLVSIFAGYYFLLRRQPGILQDTTAPEPDRKQLTPVLLPILTVVVCTLLLPFFFHQLLPDSRPAVWKLLAMLAGLAISLAYIFAIRQQDDRRLFDYLLKPKTINILFTLAGVMVFQAMLEGAGLLPVAGQELAASRVPLTLIIALLPFVAGLVTGIAIGFAGAAFPIVVGFLAAAGTAGLQPMAALTLAFSMGYAGMMLSPVHLCFVLTREYFAAPILQAYRHLLPCVASVVAYGLILYTTLRIMHL